MASASLILQKGYYGSCDVRRGEHSGMVSASITPGGDLQFITNLIKKFRNHEQGTHYRVWLESVWWVASPAGWRTGVWISLCRSCGRTSILRPALYCCRPSLSCYAWRCSCFYQHCSIKYVIAFDRNWQRLQEQKNWLFSELNQSLCRTFVMKHYHIMACACQRVIYHGVASYKNSKEQHVRYWQG